MGMGKGLGRGFKDSSARVHFDRNAWLAEHLTGEIRSRVRSALHAVWAQHQGQRVPTPQEVLERLEQRGETRQQLEAQYGELA
jgi:hypothetical protein